MLGPRETCDSTAVWLEQQERVSLLHAGKRCYDLTNMVEKPREASGSPAFMKVKNGTLDDTQLAMKAFVRICQIASPVVCLLTL
jgi:hypothetical protein